VSAYGGLLPVYLAQDPTKKEEIIQTLTEPTHTTLVGQGYNKVFLLPNCGISQDRIKEALKEHNIRLTTDISEADAVISHTNISDDYENSNNINTKTLLAHLWNYHAYHLASKGKSLLYQQSKDEHDYGGSWSWPQDAYDSIYEMDYFTGAALNLSYMIEVQNLPVISVDTVVNESATRQVLTLDLLNMIKSQIKAGHDDRALAFKILPTIHPNKNHHLLWQLAQDCSSEMYYERRNKDLKYWYKNANIETYDDCSAENMIIWLRDKNLLTSRGFRYLEPIVRKNIQIHNRDLYVFKVEVKPEYREYLKIKENE
jgi:hypothetical protein